MITPFDLSKAPHPRLLDFFLTLVPGLTLEIALSLGNPKLVQHLVQNMSSVIHIGYSVSIALALVIAYIAGGTALQLQRTIMFFLAILYRLYIRLQQKVFREFKKRPFKPGDSKLFQKIKFKVMQREDQLNHSHAIAYGVWGVAAGKLLRERYGIEPPTAIQTEQWSFWHYWLGNPKPEDIRGNQTVRVFTATGYCGIIAMWLAPALRTHFFVAFCAVLLIAGLVHDAQLIVRWNNPIVATGWRLICILRDIPTPQSAIKTDDAEDTIKE